MIRLTQEELDRINARNRGNRGAALKKATPTPGTCRTGADCTDAGHCLRPQSCESNPKKKKRPRKPPTRTEHEEQADYFTWWREYSRIVGFPTQLCFAIPNASALSDTGRIFKWAEGLTKGVTDIFCGIPANGKHGLYIEMKRRPRKADPEQVAFMEAAVAAGYDAVLCYTAKDAINITIHYLEGRK